MNNNNEFAKAAKEALIDTAVGMGINVPLNFVLISIAFHYQWSAIVATIFFTVAFTTIALIRKIYIRMHFSRRYRKKDAEAAALPK